ncbi:MAG TPA: hypothetical protein VF148_12235 [Acidimicrobiia bacterium]
MAATPQVGWVAIVVALAVGIWAVWFIDRPRGGLLVIGLSVLLLLVGGGFGPPLIGVIAGVPPMSWTPSQWA